MNHVRSYLFYIYGLLFLVMVPHNVAAQASTNTPAGLSSESLPQFVLMSFDDYITTERYDQMLPLLSTGLSNPNGSSLRATFFVNSEHNDFYFPHILWAAGHEIATHTITASTNDIPTRGAARWRRELQGAKRYLARYSAIPEEDITGFRAPHLIYTPTTFDELHRAGFLYDATVAEYLNNLSHEVGGRIYPYEMINGLEQHVTSWSIAPTASYSGLYEVPIYPVMSNDTSFVLTDNPESSTNTLDYLYALKSTFSSHYNGNRAPMTMVIHAQNLELHPDRAGMFTNFIAWAMTHTNTWFVTTREAVEFVQNPQTSQNMLTNAVYAQPLRSALSEADFHECTGLERDLRITGSCPPNYPDWDNQYHEVVSEEIDAQTVYLRLKEDDETPEVVYNLVVSNSSPHSVVAWEATFTVTTGSVYYISDTSRTTDLGGGTWQIEPEGNDMDIASGAICTEVEILIGLPNQQTQVAFGEIEVMAKVIQPMVPNLSIAPPNASSGVTLSWDETGYEYELQSSGSQTGSWNSVTSMVYSTEWTDPYENSTAAFYRVRSSP